MIKVSSLTNIFHIFACNFDSLLTPAFIILNKAVLQGIENTGGNKDVMTKEEVEKLLKNGAYDIFREDKDGSGDKESNDFVSQDIDSILERRAKTIVHENTGSKSSAAGGTFSKASFVGNANEAEVDIDDPDFWTK